MAAIIDFRTGTTLADPSDLLTPPRQQRRPQLRLVHGGRSAVGRQRRRVFLVRRVLLAVAVVMAAVVALQLGGLVVQAFAAPSPSTSPSGATRSYAVQPGDTVWSVAHQVAPAAADPAAVVDRIVQLNAAQGIELRSDSVLRAGEQLVVPASAG
jgi:hypothetical protein